MIDLLKQEAASHGDKLQVLPVHRLQSLRNEIEQFKGKEDLNGFQKWILEHKFQFEMPGAGFVVKSIIIIAIPHPPFAKVTFIKQGKKYNALSLVMSDFDRTEKYLSEWLTAKKYHVIPASGLPLKRLAVHSGLAVYGRNNITYVKGMGSFFSFAAYFSDIPCDEDPWTEMHNAEQCANCMVCFRQCPTGAIRENRFLIDNEKCLSYLNESPGEFPAWLPPSVHHCLFDCLKCQIQCPMNKEYVNHFIDSIQFSEEETEMLLAGRPLAAFPPALLEKSKRLGLDEWLDAIPRNLKVLMK